MEADISGSQRKVLSPSVRPAKALYGESGIPVKDGKTLPFVVTRSWSAPEGYYAERWFLINPTTREVLYEGPERVRLIWGLQGLTEITDEVKESFAITPGTYRIVFALDGVQGGELDIEATEVESEAA